MRWGCQLDEKGVGGTAECGMELYTPSGASSPLPMGKRIQLYPELKVCGLQFEYIFDDSALYKM